MTVPVHRCGLCGETLTPEAARTVLTCGRHRSRDRWNTAFKIRPPQPEEAEPIRRLVVGLWGHDDLFAFDRIYPVLEQTVLVADAGGAVAGLVSYVEEDGEGRIIALAVPPIYQDLGVGSSLLRAVLDRLRKNGVERILLSTTNDNIPALQMYQRRGFVVEEVLPGRVADFLEKRLGEVPGGFAGIPVRDEIRLRYAPPSPGD